MCTTGYFLDDVTAAGLFTAHTHTRRHTRFSMGVFIRNVEVWELKQLEERRRRRLVIAILSDVVLCLT